MSETPDERARPDGSELGALLALLHGADTAFATIEATYRIWRHNGRAAAAFEAEIEEERRRGAGISTYGPGRDPAPAEYEELVRLWRSGERLREEREGGWQDGSYGVRVAELWWQWNEASGAASNEDDPSVGSGIGEQLSLLLDPAPLLAVLRLRIAGRSQVAGRAALTAEGIPRPAGRRGPPRAFELHPLGSGAQRYTLQVDAERGVLLDAVAERDGQPFHRVTALDVAFDRPIPGERFVFRPPHGEEVRPVAPRRRPQPMPLIEAQRRAPFTVLMPGRVPPDWEPQCVFVEASAQPPAPAQVALSYRSGSAHESVHLSQMAAADRPEADAELIGGDGWEEVVRDGVAIRVGRPAAALDAQVRAQLERDGTSVLLSSETLGAEQLIRIAASLVPVPRSSGI